MAQMDQSIATNSMQKAETAIRRARTPQLAQLAALERTLSEEAYAAASAEFRTLGWTMAGLVLLSIALSLAVTMLVRRAMLAEIRAHRRRGGRTGRGPARRAGRGTPGP